MNPEFVMHLRALSRFIYYVTEEEDTFLKALHEGPLAKHSDRTWVFNPALGMVPLAQLIQDWGQKTHQEDPNTTNLNNALVTAYKADPREEQNFYIITDPDRYLVEPHIQRRLLNIAHQLHQDIRNIKIFIFVGSRLVVPQKLQRYIEVVHDHGLSDAELQKKIKANCEHLHMPVPPNIHRVFRGLTDYQVDAACAQSVVLTRKDKGGQKRRLDPKIVGDFKRRKLSQTSLLSHLDTVGQGFENVGGVQRFKTWAEKTKATWTEEGQKFGLRPPKGVLAVGVWGCGKSISVKALGQCWNLPVVQLEMGKLRSSGVGETEANVYRVTGLIESVAPCIIWVDEAEKSMSGGQSSSQSDAGTTSRAIGILSTWLQETKAPVCLAMTANAVDTLPIEFINRMDERFFFNLPSTEERIEIAKIHISKWGQDPDKFNLAEVAEKAANMVGREIEQAIGAAMVESFDAGKDGLDETILLTELDRKPRIFKTMAKELKELMDWVGYDPDKKEGIRARLASSDEDDAMQTTFQMVSDEDDSEDDD
jgi:hypothetical protein